MFAMLLTDSMTPFYQNISSFPTVIFTFLLTLSLLFWLVAIIGVVDIDILDIGDAEMGSSGSSMVNGAAGLLMKLGLNGVPITIILSFIALFGWTISYNAVHFLHTASFITPIRWLANVVIFMVSLYVAILLTAQAIKPLRSLFNKMSQDVQKVVLGQVATVRTSRVDEKFGEAEFNDGGAGLILKVRAFGTDQFKRHDRVVLLEYLEADNAYRVVSEDEFTNN
ncbi:MAG TPA: DUF1449 domain-containing protein [Marinagarivorans sp.]